MYHELWRIFNVNLRICDLKDGKTICDSIMRVMESVDDDDIP